MRMPQDDDLIPPTSLAPRGVSLNPILGRAQDYSYPQKLGGDTTNDTGGVDESQLRRRRAIFLGRYKREYS
jgi:hypothetical protein